MPLDNFGVVKHWTATEGGIVRCSQPDERGFKDLNSLAVSVILKLNSDKEFPTANEQAWSGCKVFLCDIPMMPSMHDLTNGADVLQRMVLDKSIVAVHCTHGRDRTGALIGAYRLLYDKWSFDDVQKERYEFGANWLLDETFDRAITKTLKQIVEAIK